MKIPGWALLKKIAASIYDFLTSIKDALKRIMKIDHGFDFPKFAKSGNVSRIHEQEARERYWILRREIELKIAYMLSKIDGKFDKYVKGQDVNEYIDKIAQPFKDAMRAKKGKIPNHECETACRLVSYYKILLIDQKAISNKLNQLNMLWRDMNFVRTRMLLEKIIEPEKLPYQLDFCRSEANNIGAQDDPEVKSLMNQAAESLDFENQSPEKNKHATRAIISLMVNLNNKRIKKLSDQVYKKKMYMNLFIILISISIIIFFINDYLLPEASIQSGDKIETIFNSYKIVPDQMKDLFWLFLLPAVIWNFFINSIVFILGIVVSTQTVFIFFAGLTGGFFSAIMKFEPLKQLPGDELYIRWYRITKPFIGAFGAIIIFVVANTGLFQLELFDADFRAALIKDPISGIGFTFGFLTGFTERLVLPKIN